MKFGISQKIKFGSDEGSYSLVTERELLDSQITATDSEAELLLKFFGRENINIGNVASDKAKSGKNFRLFPQGKSITLNLVFPKPHKTELRLYLSSTAGFKPEPNSVWFMFIKNDDLWIGSTSEADWRNENSIIIYDESEEIYQDSLAELDEIKITNLKARDVFARDRGLAIKRIQLEKYTCEYDPSHNLFDSRHTKLPYLEAHHLIPISLQKQIVQKLDVIENIFSLCPFCHRAIHHANIDLTRKIINRLVDKRPQVTSIINFQIVDFYRLYSVEDIC